MKDEHFSLSVALFYHMIMTGCVKKNECRRYKRYFTNSSTADLSAFRSETQKEGKNTWLVPTQNNDYLGRWISGPVILIV